MLYNLFENRDFVSVFAVALLAEGVDRNQIGTLLFRRGGKSPSSQRAWIEIGRLRGTGQGLEVALLAEGVDRNFLCPGFPPTSVGSPSSQRAWIEILCPRRKCRPGSVSPSSQRAWIEIGFELEVKMKLLQSPSSQRAWIEIFRSTVVPGPRPVALLAEGVDRNNQVPRLDITRSRRPPRGGRG